MTDTPLSRAARLVGSVLSERYRIDELISESDTGALYRGEHAHMRKRIAVKVLPPNAAARPDLLARFEREGDRPARTSITPATSQPRRTSASSRTAPRSSRSSTSTARRCEPRSPKRRSPPRALNIAAQIARALDAAHHEGHRSSGAVARHGAPRRARRSARRGQGRRFRPRQAPSRAHRRRGDAGAGAAHRHAHRRGPHDHRLCGAGVPRRRRGRRPHRSVRPRRDDLRNGSRRGPACARRASAEPRFARCAAPTSIVLLQRLLAADPAHRSVSAALEIAEVARALAMDIPVTGAATVRRSRGATAPILGAEAASWGVCRPRAGFSTPRLRRDCPPPTYPRPIQLAALRRSSAIIVIVLLADRRSRADSRRRSGSADPCDQRSAPTATKPAPEPDRPERRPGRDRSPDHRGQETSRRSSARRRYLQATSQVGRMQRRDRRPSGASSTSGSYAVRDDLDQDRTPPGDPACDLVERHHDGRRRPEATVQMFDLTQPHRRWALPPFSRHASTSS